MVTREPQWTRTNPGERIVARRWILRAGLFLSGCGFLIACGEEMPSELGEPFDPAHATPLSKLLTDDDVAHSGSVIVSGRIGSVCQSSGCWFTLQEAVDGKVYEIFTDLQASASFTVAPGVQGRKAVVAGSLVGKGPDLQLRAIGLVLE